jgi:hypothetical protein
MAAITLTRPDLAEDDERKYALVVPLTDWELPTDCGTIVEARDVRSICGPPEMLSVWSYQGYYSPASCPKGYITSCVRFHTDTYHVMPVGKGQTVASCIPRYIRLPSRITIPSVYLLLTAR